MTLRWRPNNAQRWLASLSPEERRAHLQACARRKAEVSTAGNFKPRVLDWAAIRRVARGGGDGDHR